MTEVKLSNGLVALVDPDDFDLVSHRRWHCFDGSRKYAYCWDPYPAILLMHRLIMEPPFGLMVDHINHDGLDNRRENLRIVTNGQSVNPTCLEADDG